MRRTIAARTVLCMRGGLRCAAFIVASTAMAQATPHAWHAQWIAAADGPARDYDVVYFRRQLTLSSVPEHFLVDISADTRFELHEWWPFVDWSPPLYDGGVPPQQADGGSSAITLQFIAALRDAADLEVHLGEPERATRYREQAARAAAGLIRLSWDEARGLLADIPAKTSFSQQANALAVLLDVVPKAQQRAVMRKVLDLSKPSPTVAMSQASYYFRFYLARAMVHTGLGDEYIPQLDPWRKMLALGLSTWAENPEPTRSDSHAWSAHPTYDLLTIVAGIAPSSPGFETVDISPNLGNLKQSSATMPTPKGLVEVRYTRAGNQWKADITLPPGLPGELHWQGRSILLHAGAQTIQLPQ